VSVQRSNRKLTVGGDFREYFSNMALFTGAVKGDDSKPVVLRGR